MAKQSWCQCSTGRDQVEAQSVQDILQAFVIGQVLQPDGDAGLQTRAHLRWGAHHPAQVFLPHERVAQGFV